MTNAAVLPQTLALVTSVAWASGINAYAVLLFLGGMGASGLLQLPPDLQILAHPWVLTASGLMYGVEFFADKIPALDTAWDTLHTFIRIPTGALLAAGAVNSQDPALVAAATIVGGNLAAHSHVLKAGTRVLVNTTPEPVSNGLLSLGEDLAVFAGLWTALRHPWVFLTFLALFGLLSLWLLPRIWRGILPLASRLRRLWSRLLHNSAS